ncbi:MAG: autotransporter-associated beta strand repeat-containing protein [Verrucomicrobiales bacterium]|nr:autotransporter-associated beta strand repeat-containing protein [Verrucomicrobiales bacterium]
MAFGPNATNNPQSLVLGGGSSGDNRFFPNITDNSAGTGAATSVYKADSGVWYLMGTNTYSGVTELRGGALYVEDGVSLPTASNLVFNGGVVATTGLLSRTIGTGASQMSFASSATTANFRGGFAAGGSKLTVDWGSGNVWGSTANFISDGDGLIFGAANGQTSVTKADVELVSDFSLGTATGVDSTGLSYSLANSSSTVTVGSTAGLVVGQAFSGTNVPAGAYIVSINSATQFSLSANTGSTAAGSFTNGATVGGSLRTIRVDDNGNIGADFATLSGDISGTAGTGIRKMGSGILVMNGDNSYSGETNVFQGTLVVDSLGNSSGSGTSSLGTEVNANLDSNALTLGNGSTGAGILEYVGEGETSDRKIRLNTTTGNTQIHADGVGPLILTNVANDMVSGAKALYLRGVSASTNMITSQLSDNGGALSLVIDGSTSWVLTNSGNNYTGNTTVSAGALGIGSDTAIGGNLVLSNGSIFAYGADRTIANSVQLANNTSTSFIGDYSLDFTSPLQLLASANNVSLNNSIADGETLTFSAGVTANSLTANRGWTIDGTGTTIIDGDFTSSTAFGVALTKTGDGVFQLNGTGSNFNQGNATIDIDRGTLRIGGNGVIPDGTGYGNVVMSPDLVNGDTAILDLNGFTETINGLTMNTDGTAIIDNTSATAASLLFGGNDQAVSIGGGTGVYTIQNSGGGALSLTKIGSNTALIPTGVTLDYTGTTNVTGGTFTIASPVNGTTGLSATNSSTLALTGGITDPSLVTSIEVGGGSTLSLLDGVGSSLSNLTSLSLGNTGTGTATLNLNIGDGATDYLSLLTRGTLNLGNSVTFNMTDAGLAANTTYTLLNIVDGGINAYGITNMMQGATPGGFDMFTWFVDDNYVKLTTGNLITSDLYWRGSTDNTWNANVNNWSTDKSGSPAAVSIPGAGSKVFFAWDGIGTGPLTTTLEQNFKVNALVFESGTTTPSSVTIDPGAVSTNRIEVAPTNATDGISISAGGPSTVTMSAPVKIGADQTWNVSDAGSVLSIGALLGEADITKTGAGKVILPYASDPTFNSGVTSNLDITGGTVEIQNVGSLGNPVNSNLVNVTVGTGGAFYYNGASGTVANPIELAGGTLSSGTGTTTFSGPIDISANSIVNMADSNGAPTATARSITMSGVVSGSGTITVDSNNTASGGNQVGGTLTMSNAGNTWTGDLAFNRGTVTLTNAASPSFTTNDVTFNSFGRLILQGLNGATLDHSGDLTYAAGAIGEFQVDNTSSALSADFTVNQDGVMTLGSGGTGGTVRFYLADAYSKLNINGGVVLGGTSSISVGGDATGVVVIPSVISDGGSGYGLNVNDDAGGWNTTDRTLRLLGLNTFTGNVSLDSGVLEYDTVTNIAGGASALGSGSAINFTNSATLRFIGTTAQSTDRPITSTAGVITLSANGDEVTDTITYAGPITVGPTADGSQIILTGVPGREGIISGGISETGTTADMTVNGGTWTHATGTSNIGDDMVVTGADTIFNLASGVFQVRDDFTVQLGANLNLNATGALSFNTASLSADASLRAVSGATITINATDAINPTQFDGLRIGVDADGLGTLVLNADQTVTEFILGNRTFAREGLVDGTGTLTVAGNLDLYEGTINANLASTGSTALEKIGSETVTLAGDNSGLASTGSSIVYAGTLALDYTADNNTKLRAASALDLRGGTLQMIGNNGAATTQTVGSLTLASGGASTIIVDGGTGQEAVLNLGAITRGNLASDGTIRFVLPDGTQSATNGITTTSPNSIYGLLGTGATSTADAAYATVEDGTGLWFATNVGGNIVPLASTVNNDVTSWMMGDHITDSGSGFTGTAACININSLRYDAAGGSDLVVNDGTDIRIGSGGILVTSNVGGTPTMMGGNLVTGSGEVVVTQESAQTFQIGSMIGGTQAVVKSGTGTLLLSGLNTYTGATDIQSGTLQVGGGNAIGDSSPVNLATYEDSTLELLADEVIGRLSGGQRQTDDDHGVVAVNDHALTIVNSGANTTYSGVFTGTGSIIKQGTHNLNLNGISSGYTGVVTVDSGLLQLSGSGQINASVIRVNKGGALLLDNNGTTRSGTRILDTTTVTLDSADGTYNGQTIVRGLAIRTDQNANTSETIGTLNFASGANYLSGEGDVGTGTASSYIIADEFVRLNNATLAARGRSLGASSGERNQFKIGTAANETAFISTLVGGGGAAGTNTISIIPWAIAAANSGTNGALTDADMGNSLATYVAGTGIRPLDFATEYNTYSAAAATENVRESLTANLTGLSGKTVNALVINDNTTAASTTNVTGTGSGQMLTNTSGAFLFTLNTAATASSAHSVVLGGFDDGIAVGGGEYVFQVVNPSAAANTATLAATISSPLVTAADITKSGRGRLVLSGVNTAGGGANHTTLNEGQLEISDLDNIGGNTGGLVFAGGTLRIGAGFVDDISTRTISVLTGGGTIDTAGVNITVANGLGSGSGPLTKTGAGTLTMTGTSTSALTNVVTVTQGTLELAQTAGTAIGSGGLYLLSTANPTTVLFSEGNQIADNAPVTVESTGSNGAVFNLNGFTDTIGSLTVTGTTTNGSTVQTGSGGVLTVTGDITMNNNRNSTGNTGREVLITGTGTLGSAAPDSGTLDLGGAERTITVNRTGTNTNMDATIETIIQNGGIIKAGTQTLILTGTNTYADGTTIDDGTIRISSTANLGADVAGNDLTFSGGTLQSTGASVIIGASRNVSLMNDGGTIDVAGATTNAVVINGVVDGTDCAPLNKVGIGALALTNANTYEGGTNVNAGSLVVANTTGSATGTGQVTVAAGAVLTGDGAIEATGGNNVTINGSVLVGDPTSMTGTDLAISATGGGSVIFGTGSTTSFDIWGGLGSAMLNAAADADRLILGSQVTLGGTLDVTNSSGSTAWAKFDSWQLFDWSGITGGVTPGTAGNEFSSINLPDLSSYGYVWDLSDLYIGGTITVVPEPARVMLVLAGLGAVLLRRRRR